MFSLLGAEFSAVMLHNRGMVEVSIDAIVTAATFLVAVVAMVTFMRSEQKRTAERHDQLRKDLTDEIRGLRQELVAQFAEHKREVRALLSEHRQEIQTQFAEHKQQVHAMFTEHREEVRVLLADHKTDTKVDSQSFKDQILAEFRELKNETATRFDSIDERLHIIENDVAHIKGSLGLPLLVVPK